MKIQTDSLFKENTKLHNRISTENGQLTNKMDQKIQELQQLINTSSDALHRIVRMNGQDNIIAANSLRKEVAMAIDAIRTSILELGKEHKDSNDHHNAQLNDLCDRIEVSSVVQNLIGAVEDESTRIKLDMTDKSIIDIFERLEHVKRDNVALLSGIFLLASCFFPFISILSETI